MSIFPMYTTPELEAHIKALYDTYYHTKDLDEKGTFYSPACRQICRSNPSFAARNSDEIVQYLRDYAQSNETEPKGGYNIRLVKAHEFEFGLADAVVPAGYHTPDEVRDQAVNEGWIGMRVDLWDDTGLMVKVHYWWRREGETWLQILHDIHSLDKKEATPT